MKPKKTNIKIKRRKYNLYNKKKSKSRQVLSIVITIAAACVLGVVGYGVGKPIMNYLQNREQYVSGEVLPRRSKVHRALKARRIPRRKALIALQRKARLRQARLPNPW